LLGTILETSELDANNLSIETEALSLASTLKEIKQLFDPIAQSKKINLQIEIASKTIYSNALQIKRLISNLVSNALRFTPEYGTVKIRCRERNQVFWIQVWDNGMGIPANDQPRLFEEFFRGVATDVSRADGGLQRLAKHLNHSILVRSRFGRGSMFAVGIHQYAACSPIHPSFTESTQNQNNLHQKLTNLLSGLLLLIIDDDTRVLEDMRIFFQIFNCRVQAYLSTQAALHAVEKDFLLPDLIISDFRLQEQKTGAEAIQSIRQTLQENIPAVLITAEYTSPTEDPKKFGGLPVVTKPIDVTKLTLILEILLPARNYI
jgi:two-component system, sensor histidine kinase